MIIKQLQLGYSAEEDRLLIRINSNDGQEIRCWLTRRMILRLIPSLNQMMTTMITSDRPLAEPAKAAILDMTRQAALQNADFATPFAEKPANLPLGPEPLVVSKIELHPLSDTRGADIMMKMATVTGHGFEIRMAEQLQHGFFELIRKSCAQADWGFEIPAQESFFPAAGQHLN